MKKFLMMAALVLAAASANAQTWIGGNLGYNYSDNGFGTKRTDISISPEIGFSITDKWDFAVNLDYTMGKVKNGATIHEFVVNPYARYTFAKSGIASFFVDGGISVGAHKVKDGGDADAIFGIAFQPGIALHVSDRVSLVTKIGSLGYRHVGDADAFGLNVNNEAITFGAYYTF
ncbi:MAG: outer membrane beta-barrel protein [Bacteroidaceae bacterium]|nr:outer membrane beta-barrel protein [Bacteroidaceae bacterium]